MAEKHALAAGEFGAWLQSATQALATGAPVDVPCGGCTACCTSGYFIPIGPDETPALKRIPKKFLVPAPGRPEGHKLLGHYENGHCAMLSNGACSIYEDRPLACRRYDCRIFAASGISVGGDDKAAIQQRVGRWKFSYGSEGARDLQAALRAAASLLTKKNPAFPAGALPTQPNPLAALAIKVHHLFLAPMQGFRKTRRKNRDADLAEAILEIHAES